MMLPAASMLTPSRPRASSPQQLAPLAIGFAERDAADAALRVLAKIVKGREMFDDSRP